MPTTKSLLPPVNRVTASDFNDAVLRFAKAGRLCPAEDFPSAITSAVSYGFSSTPTIGEKVGSELCNKFCNTKKNYKAILAMQKRVSPFCWRWFFEELALQNGATNITCKEF